MELPPKPQQIHNLEFIRILSPYVFASRVVRGKSVLDVGCGWGHGSWLLLAQGARQLAAADLDTTRLRHVSRLCRGSQLAGIFAMDAQRLAFRDRSFEVVTCFEVIEHVPEPAALLSELRRILVRDGVLLLTTPNRSVRLLPLQRPWNPEHLREYRLGPLRKLLRAYFPSVEVMGVRGSPREYAFYRRKWRQRPIRVYLEWLVPLLSVCTPAVLKRLARTRIGQTSRATVPHSNECMINKPVPAPDAANWPFHLAEASRECLNFLAVCGLDSRSALGALEQIRLAHARRE